MNIKNFANRPRIEEWNQELEELIYGDIDLWMIRTKFVNEYALSLEREKVDRKQEFVSFVEHHEAQEKDWRNEKAELERENAAYNKANKDFQESLITANKERAALEARLKAERASVNELSRHCQDLEDHLDLCRDEFKRILSCPGVDPEITGLAERGYKNITQHVHVITQRDDALTKVATLESRLEKTEEALKNIKTFADERAECSVYLANIAWACNEALKGLGKEI